MRGIAMWLVVAATALVSAPFAQSAAGDAAARQFEPPSDPRRPGCGGAPTCRLSAWSTSTTAVCSGALLTNEWLITAAHCLSAVQTMNPASVTVRARWGAGQTRNATRIYRLWNSRPTMIRSVLIWPTSPSSASRRSPSTAAMPATSASCRPAAWKRWSAAPSRSTGKAWSARPSSRTACRCRRVQQRLPDRHLHRQRHPRQPVLVFTQCCPPDGRRRRQRGAELRRRPAGRRALALSDALSAGSDLRSGQLDVDQPGGRVRRCAGGVRQRGVHRATPRDPPVYATRTSSPPSMRRTCRRPPTGPAHRCGRAGGDVSLLRAPRLRRRAWPGYGASTSPSCVRPRRQRGPRDPPAGRAGDVVVLVGGATDDLQALSFGRRWPPPPAIAAAASSAASAAFRAAPCTAPARAAPTTWSACSIRRATATTPTVDVADHAMLAHAEFRSRGDDAVPRPGLCARRFRHRGADRHRDLYDLLRAAGCDLGADRAGRRLWRGSGRGDPRPPGAHGVSIDEPLIAPEGAAIDVQAIYAVTTPSCWARRSVARSSARSSSGRTTRRLNSCSISTAAAA